MNTCLVVVTALLGLMGMVRYTLLLATCLGYVFVWGQLSKWGLEWSVGAFLVVVTALLGLMSMVRHT